MLYDLTTSRGIADINSSFPGLFDILGWFWNKIFGSAPSPEEQIKAAIELIKVAKETGAKSIDIEISSKSGVDFSCPVQGTKITMSAGSKGKTRIHVEFV